MNDDKITFWGTLDITARTLEDVPPVFQKVWEKGTIRMRPEDVKRMQTYLKRIHAAELSIRNTLSNFKSLNK